MSLSKLEHDSWELRGRDRGTSVGSYSLEIMTVLLARRLLLFDSSCWRLVWLTVFLKLVPSARTSVMLVCIAIRASVLHRRIPTAGALGTIPAWLLTQYFWRTGGSNCCYSVPAWLASRIFVAWPLFRLRASRRSDFDPDVRLHFPITVDRIWVRNAYISRAAMRRPLRHDNDSIQFLLDITHAYLSLTWVQWRFCNYNIYTGRLDVSDCG